MQEIKIYAPVVIPTLSRYEHFKRCIESLSKCTYSNQTEVFIGLDYPLKEEHIEGWKLITQYLQNQNLPFKKMTILKREENFGVSKNSEELRKVAFEKYDRVIISEDDNVFSTNFLDFVNKGLELYKDDERIMAVSGYNYPIEIPESKSGYYFSSNFSAWGCGLWKNKMLILEETKSKQYLLKVLFSFSNVLRLLKMRTQSVLSLITSFKSNTYFGDVLFGCYLCLNRKYSIFPTVSKVQNHGHDGSGLNCSKMKFDIYKNQEIDSHETFSMKKIIPKKNKTIENKLSVIVGNCNLRTRVKAVLEYIKFIFMINKYK